MPKKYLLPAGLILLVIIGIGIFLVLKPQTSQPAEIPNKRQIINALPINERPFVALFPHPSSKLITLLLDKPGSIPELTIDLEYLSGNALKGGRSTVKFPASLPYTQAFLLGSCSSGGKCSFDTNITTGTIKTKIEKADEVHVLKSNYVFIKGPSATTDQKLRFTPGKKYTAQAILGYSHGYLGEITQEAVSEPFVITSDSPDTITGTLSFIASGTTSLLYYDGKEYQELKVTQDANQFTAELEAKPWSREVTITRDDLKGATETATLYLVGPFIPVK